MRAPAAALVALGLALAAAPAPARAQRPSLMDRLVALFREGRPIGVQVMFEALETEHDLDFNTTVAEVREKRDEKARYLVVATESYEHLGARYRFVFALREGALGLFDLQRRAGDTWEAVGRDQFWFQLEDKGAADFLASGDAVVHARGACNHGRGARTRARATLAVRTFHTETGRPLRY